MWNKTTKPTPANIRRRISAAQEAIDGALDLLKRNDRLWPSGAGAPKPAKSLVNACDWLTHAQRQLSK